MPTNISVTILTKNSQQHLSACLQALNGFDEVVIVDNGSTDDTVALAGAFPNTKIVHSPFIGFGPLKNLAARHASHSWILSIDSDEVMSEELAQEIVHLDLQDPQTVYSFKRNNYYRGKVINACGWQKDYVLRLYQKHATRFADLPVHEYLHTKGLRMQVLNGGILNHYSFDNMAQLIDKMQHYSSLFAHEKRFVKRSSPGKSTVKWAFSFFKNYVLQRGFLYGYEGLGISFSNASGTFYKYMKLHEENQRLGISLIITTYNWKEALAVVMKSAFEQTELPLEIIIADDGSGDDTRAAVEALAQVSPVPVRHCWHKDLGFRAAESRNKAMAMAAGEYLVIIDGDIVLPPDFLENHRRAAQKGYFVQGKRVLLNRTCSQEMLSGHRKRITPFTPGIKNRLNALRSLFLSGIFSKRKQGIASIKSCNMAFWRNDVLKVNGFNEDFVGWGREDSEFAVRLLNNGIKRKNMAFGGAGYHLCHPENPRQSLPVNDAILEKAIREKHTHCANGISKHLPK